LALISPHSVRSVFGVWIDGAYVGWVQRLFKEAFYLILQVLLVFPSFVKALTKEYKYANIKLPAIIGVE
jgi:hypothetical protein